MSLQNALDNQQAVRQSMHGSHVDSYTRRSLSAEESRIEESVHQAEDTYNITPELTKEQLRVLFKIINKDLPDCGRKRGAIFRYIKAYMPEPKPNYGQRIVQRLNNL